MRLNFMMFMLILIVPISSKKIGKNILKGIGKAIDGFKNFQDHIEDNVLNSEDEGIVSFLKNKVSNSNSQSIMDIVTQFTDLPAVQEILANFNDDGNIEAQAFRAFGTLFEKMLNKGFSKEALKRQMEQNKNDELDVDDDDDDELPAKRPKIQPVDVILKVANKISHPTMKKDKEENTQQMPQKKDTFNQFMKAINQKTDGLNKTYDDDDDEPSVPRPVIRANKALDFDII